MNAMERINQLANARETELLAEREAEKAKEIAAQKRRDEALIAISLKVLTDKLEIQPKDVLEFNGSFCVLSDFEITFNNLTDQGDSFYVWGAIQVALPPELEDEEEQYEYYSFGSGHYTAEKLALEIRSTLEVIKERIKQRWSQYNESLKNTTKQSVDVTTASTQTPPQVVDELRRLIKELVYEAFAEYYA